MQNFEDEVAIFLQFAYETNCFQNNQNNKKLKKKSLFILQLIPIIYMLSDVFLDSITIMNMKKKSKNKNNAKEKTSTHSSCYL